MCGIIGYVGEKQALPVLIEGLKRLEYRGYDSAGICISDKDELKLIKKKGKISELLKEIKSEELRGHIGIAHTRWATHRIPNDVNAHPHLSKSKNIAIV